MDKVYIYTRFNRLWHWLQALMIMVLIVTGCDIHFAQFQLMPFERAIAVHNATAFAFIILTLLSVFWHITTGQWKQYIPTNKKLGAMIGYYLTGIFLGAPHPTQKTPEARLNPLQRIAYLMVNVVLLPLVVVSGLLYFFFNDWERLGMADVPLSTVALIHTAATFLLITFLVAHIYLITTGHTPTSHLKSMVTGWEEMKTEGTEKQKN